MNRRSDESQGAAAAIEELAIAGNEPAVDLLGAVLDGHLLFGKAFLPPEEIEPFFEAWRPERSFGETVGELQRSGLLRVKPEGVSVPRSLRMGLIGKLGSHCAERRPVRLAGVSVAFEEVLGGFERYARNEGLSIDPLEAETWGEKIYRSEGRLHRFLRRPRPLLLKAHPSAFILMVSEFPPEGVEAVAGAFAKSRPLRDRLALYALEGAEKINLTRSSVFVYFERYVRRAYGLRVGPALALSRSLEDAGILSLQMG